MSSEVRPYKRLKQRDIVQSIKALRSAGETGKPRVEIDPVSGRIRIEMVEPAQESKSKNEWDDVL